jgi:hypothetical protein
VSDAADRRIAELEHTLFMHRTEHAEYLARTRRDLANMTREVLDLRKQLVERDVYEAEARLPPEQAALIKHLTTVEWCIEEGPVTYHHAEESDCSFCDEWQGHKKDCAWLALQLDRKPAETMALVEGWAWDENARRDRERARAMTPQRPGRNTMIGLSEWLKNTYPEQRIAPLSTDMVDAAAYNNAQIAYRREYLGEFPTRDTVTYAPNPVAPNLGIGGEEQVADSDDDKVP